VSVIQIRAAKIFFPIGPGKPKRGLVTTIAYKTASGRVAKVDGVPAWESTDPTVFEVKNVAADGLSAELWPADAADGVAELKITADVDLGAGVTNLETLVGIEARPAEATNATVTLGTAIPKP